MTLESRVKRETENRPLSPKKGSRGAEVKAWQLLLKENGYPLLVDGIFGDMTMEAVMDWQDKHGLKPDGIIGHKTWATVG